MRDNGNVSFGDIVLALGTSVAARLALHLGGYRLDIPFERPSAESRLVKAIGMDAALDLCRQLGGSRVTIPARMARLIIAHQMRRDGRAVGDIANTLRLSRSGVQRLLRQSPPVVDNGAPAADCGPEQLDMFG
jgi:hypothetical protein